MVKTFLASGLVLLLGGFAGATEPEMWVVPLGHELPAKSPEGRKVMALPFTVFMLLTDEHATYSGVSLFYTMRFQVFDLSNHALEEQYGANFAPLPVLADALPLILNEPVSRAYAITLRGKSLVVYDHAGSPHGFKLTERGKYRLVVTFDDRARDSTAQKFENRWDAGGDSTFYHGRQKCGEFVFEVTDLEDAPK